MGECTLGLNDHAVGFVCSALVCALRPRSLRLADSGPFEINLHLQWHVRVQLALKHSLGSAPHLAAPPSFYLPSLLPASFLEYRRLGFVSSNLCILTALCSVK